MKIAILYLIIFTGVLPVINAAGGGLYIGGISVSHLYLPIDSAAAAKLQYEVVAGELLSGYIKRYPKNNKIKGNVSIKINSIEADEDHQEGELLLLAYNFEARDIEPEIAKAYQTVVDRYLDLRVKGFTKKYAIELIFQSEQEANLVEDVKFIAKQYDHANPRKLNLIRSERINGSTVRTYIIKDGSFEWIYYFVIEESGRYNVHEVRRKLGSGNPSVLFR